MKGVLLVGALFSIGIELLQLLTGLLASMTFRIADINDLLFNTLGAGIGYLLFLGLDYIACKFTPNLKKSAMRSKTQ